MGPVGKFCDVGKSRSLGSRDVGASTTSLFDSADNVLSAGRGSESDPDHVRNGLVT